tara:strand:+ start:123 stop:353 length:231 start_codon:yes stop_codon:yes gene_type:complete
MARTRIKMKDLGKVLKAAIEMAEVIFPSEGAGPSKREFVVDLVNSKIDVPLLTEKQERIVLGILVDVVCSLVLSRI